MELKQLDIFESPHFYVTVPCNAEQEEKKALSQEAFILSILSRGVEYTPYDVMELCEAKGRRMKENSVRRALNNLMNKEKYEKIEIERTGNWVINQKYSSVPNQTIRLK